MALFLIFTMKFTKNIESESSYALQSSRDKKYKTTLTEFMHDFNRDRNRFYSVIPQLIISHWK